MSQYNERAKQEQYYSMRIYLNEEQRNFKDLIKQHKTIMGFESMSEYVVDLIDKDLKRRKIINKKTGV
jgi:hypothetical protein